MPSYTHEHRVVLPERLSASDLEAWCFTNRWPHGVGRYGHFRRYAALTWPSVEWNPWLERSITTLCDDSTGHHNGSTHVKTVAMTGCAAGGKTFSAAFFASTWWRMDPSRSAVILCSTTKDMLRKRVWLHIPTFWMEAVDEGGYSDPVGHLIESRTQLLYEKGDDLHGIFGIAVGEGETQKAIQQIKGVHAPRVMVVVDEAEATPEAIFGAIANLRKGCQEFVLVVLGNSVSKLDPHGQVCEPRAGWKAIGVDTESWPTKGVPRWQIDPGVCLHFDGAKSPNVIAGRTLYPYLYTFEDHVAAQNRADYTESMAYWSHDRGFWPPEGLSDRIFTEQMVEKYDGTGTYEYLGGRRLLAFLDTAFGGDDCKLTFGVMGDTVRSVKGLAVTGHLNVPITAASKDEIDYQIARRVQQECVARGVEPSCFGTDATGIGRGVHAILAGEWSPEVQRVEFGGAPSDRPSSTADGRPAKEVYDRFVTELWWTGRELLQAGQLKGLYPDAIVQMCKRLYEMKGRKYSIEDKPTYKVRVGRSPDDADAVMGLIEVARRNGLTITTAIVKRTDRDWTIRVKAASDIYADPGAANVPEFEAEAPMFDYVDTV